MEQLKNENGADIIRKLADAIADKKEFLSEIDGVTGDGDHGINMNKGFRLAADNMEEDMTMDQAFQNLGMTLVNDIGGSMGPIYGSFFMNVAANLREEEWITKEIFLKALYGGRQAIVSLTGAEKGDKTILDTLFPAVEAYQSAMQEQDDFKGALQAMKKAASKGLESTRDMEAKVGRASRLGKRSIGHLDAGAASCYIILESISDAFTERLN